MDATGTRTSGRGPLTGGARRFDSPGQMAREMFATTTVAPDLWKAYRGRLPAARRERIMVAVSHANACAGCSRVHQRWALRAGVTDEELEALGLEDLAGLEPADRAAVVYAVERSTSGFPGPAGAPSRDPDVSAAMARYFNDAEVRQIDAVARAITFANLTVGSVERLRERITA